ncbi:hypothetical protein AWC22_23185 [Mycobacterium riyadhense]|uniref:Uncharacterized protein n=1 Tax=Mycobacterium riyadhense TaxID=486698 RepID=A0A1X2CH24_9MYCO|nr:hypothetical protein AWC22_23185 [Mycobacterium riyadhense]
MPAGRFAAVATATAVPAVATGPAETAFDGAAGSACATGPAASTVSAFALVRIRIRSLRRAAIAAGAAFEGSLGCDQCRLGLAKVRCGPAPSRGPNR